jgi:hypothetical protein
MNLDGDNIYTKIVDLDEIYNFVAQYFFIWNHLCAQIIDVMFRYDEPEELHFSLQHIFKNYYSSYELGWG